MKVIAKKGFEIDVQVSGFCGKFDSVITASFSVAGAGKIAKNADAKIVRNGKIAEGLYFPKLNGYVECPVSAIEEAIEQLPEKIKMYRKVEKNIDADGDIVKVQKWYRDGFEVVSPIAAWLDTLGVSEIEAGKADAMYAEYESEANAKKVDAGFEDDVMEEGFEQACENAGIDKLAMVGYEKAQTIEVEAEAEIVEEITIEKHDIEKLGDISAFQDFDPEADFPIYVDRHGVENKNRIRIFYGSEYWNDLNRKAEENKCHHKFQI
jgi:hypothetical protein